jgi:hypothetical protein
MTAVYTVRPNEVDDFFKAYQTSFGTQTVKVSIEPVWPPKETNEEVHERLLRSMEAQKRGEGVSMTMEQLEEMVK